MMDRLFEWFDWVPFRLYKKQIEIARWAIREMNAKAAVAKTQRTRADYWEKQCMQHAAKAAERLRNEEKTTIPD